MICERLKTFFIYIAKIGMPLLRPLVLLRGSFSNCGTLARGSQRKIGNIKVQLAMAKEVLHSIEIARDSRALSTAEEKTQTTLPRFGLP